MNAHSAALVLLLVAAPAVAQQQRDDLWSTNGAVEAVAQHGNTLYLGGSFSLVGPATGSLVAIDPTTGAATLPPLLVDGVVHTVVADGSGGIYVGGVFEHVQGQARSNAARISGTGTLLPWNPNATGGAVLAITRNGGTVYLGGDFAQVGGQARSRLAAVDTTNGTLQAWNPGANATVYALQAQNGLLYVGGAFTIIAATGRNRVCALDPSTAIAAAWNPNCNGPVTAMFIRYDVIDLTLTAYVGGTFTVVGGQTRTNLATVDATVGAPTFNQATSFAPAPNGYITSMRVVGNTIPVLYVGGVFTTIAGQPRNHVASFNGGTLTAWNPNANSTVNAVHLSGSTIYLGGAFSSLGGLARSFAGAVNSSGTAVTNAWAPLPWSAPNVFATSGSNLWMGGSFTALGGQVRQGLAALDLTTGQATPWNPGADANVHALTWVGDDLYVGGQFTNVGGQPRSALARFDAVGALSPWAPPVTGYVQTIVSRPLDATTSLLYLGGGIYSVGDSVRGNLAAVTTAIPPAVTGWAPYTDRVVTCLDVDATHVYVGGAFTAISGQTYSSLARVDFAGNVDSWQPNVPWVADVKVSGNDVYVASFDPLTPDPTKKGVVKRIPKNANTATWTRYAAGTLDVLLLGPSGLDVGGYYYLLDGVSQQGVGRLDVGTGDRAAWDPAVRNFNDQPHVLDLREANGLLFLAGVFTSVGGKARSGIAALYDGVLAVPSSPPSGRVALRAAPNPSSNAQTFTFDVAGTIEIRNVAGRLVRTLAPAAGARQVAWDGRSNEGARVGPGIYFATLSAGNERVSAKVLRLD